MAFVEEDDVLSVLERVCADVFKKVLNITLPTPFPRLTHQEAMTKHRTEKPDLHTADTPWAFCWITDFPLFERNAQTQRLEATHHPFTAPHPDDAGRLTSDPAKVRARAYDLVLNGVEIGSGSIRIHQEAMQREVFKVLGLSEDTVRERFGFLLQAFRFGAPPHGGFALGLDRLIALIAKTPSIRDVIAFPKTQKAIDPVTDAPSLVTEAQLKDLGVAVLTPKR